MLDPKGKYNLMSDKIKQQWNTLRKMYDYKFKDEAARPVYSRQGVVLMVEQAKKIQETTDSKK